MARVNKEQNRKLKEHKIVVRLTEKVRTVQSATRTMGIPRSTFYYQTKNLMREKKTDVFRHNQLTEHEEGIIVRMLQKYSKKGHPLYRTDIAEAAKLMLYQLFVERRSNLRWKSHRPGRRFISLFN